ncbi:MAG: PQQ-dependent sugar dehydrogenase [Pirellulaceae bacterium]|nr:PQQ-dependent sugar dehydrogenase [Pirellulaceae bacterium]
MLTVSNHASRPLPAQSLTLTRVATGLSSPLYGTSAPGQSEYLYIVERGGNIRILDVSSQPPVVLATPFLTAAQLSEGNGLTSGNERGLLGMAFHPDYVNNGRYYVNYTDSGGHTRIRSYQRSSGNPLITDSTSRAEILQISQPASNHNGGWICFGPDGFMYVATGDGGGSNDPQNAGQNKNTLLGKMLRIAPGTTSSGGYTIPVTNPLVGQANTRGEIWAYGLRNPWRNSFDRSTGDLYIADVGQGAREELNFQYSNSLGGENYGWRLREGTIQTPGLVGGARPPGNVDPIYNYSRGTGLFQGASVTGGYVYRGPIVGLHGHYFFGDYVSQRLFSLRFNGSLPTEFNGTNYNTLIDWNSSVQLNVGSMGNISSFAEDAAGHLYLISLGGNVYRFTSGFIIPPSIQASYIYHGQWSGAGELPWAGLDSTKTLVQFISTPLTLGLDNLSNSQHGLDGIALDIANLNDPDDVVWEFKMSPQGAYDLGANPISSWPTAPTPTSINHFAGAGVGGSHRILIQWPEQSILDRWLSVKLTLGNFSRMLYVGHLRGEVTGHVDGVYTVSFADISEIRGSVGNEVDAGSALDIDKNGIVSFADILAMRSAVGQQLTNLVVP